MYLHAQSTLRDDLSAVLMFFLAVNRQPDDATDREVVFRTGLTDGNSDSPDFVVPLEDIAQAFPEFAFEIADEPLGMALRVVAGEIDPAIIRVANFVSERCQADTVRFAFVIQWLLSFLPPWLL